MSIKESIKLHTQTEVDLARKEGYEIAESLYQNVIKNLTEEHKKEIKRLKDEKMSNLQ